MTVKQGTGRPTRGYRLANGDKVPSVTQITDRFKDSGGLIGGAKKRAYEAGLAGEELRWDKGFWGDGLEVGTICHGWIEDYIHGREFFDPYAELVHVVAVETIDAALAGFRAFKDWAESAHLEVLETEVPLVSEKYKYGGTFDALALVAGKPKLLDWKTSNAVYPEYIAQVAAYRQLLREREAQELVFRTDSALLLRIGKEMGDFHLHSYPSAVLDLGWEYFEHALHMYGLDKRLAKVAT